MVLGHRGVHPGLVVFFERPAVVLHLQGALPGEHVTYAGFAAALFDGSRDGAARAEAVFNDGHPYGAQPPNTVRRPRPAELLLLEAGLRAVPLFLGRSGGRNTDDLSIAVASGTVRVTLSRLVEGEREL
jgi:hypothetical protein